MAVRGRLYSEYSDHIHMVTAFLCDHFVYFDLQVLTTAAFKVSLKSQVRPYQKTFEHL